MHKVYFHHEIYSHACRLLFLQQLHHTKSGTGHMKQELILTKASLFHSFQLILSSCWDSKQSSYLWQLVSQFFSNSTWSSCHPDNLATQLIFCQKNQDSSSHLANATINIGVTAEIQSDTVCKTCSALLAVTKSWLLYFLVTCCCEIVQCCSTATWTLFQGWSEQTRMEGIWLLFCWIGFPQTWSKWGSEEIGEFLETTENCYYIANPKKRLSKHFLINVLPQKLS